MKRLLRLEMLIGTTVRSMDGRRVGRIEEILAGERQEIAEFHLGEGALWERLSALGLFRRRKKGYRVRWDQLDWSDRQRPILNCPLSEVSPL